MIGRTLMIGVALLAAAAPALAAGDWETGPNISGESSAAERRELLKENTVRKDDSMRIDVPRAPDGLPMKPVRGLSRVEEMEMDDLEYRYNTGQIGEAEYYSRRNAIMQRVGLEPEY